MIADRIKRSERERGRRLTNFEKACVYWYDMNSVKDAITKGKRLRRLERKQQAEHKKRTTDA